MDPLTWAVTTTCVTTAHDLAEDGSVSGARYAAQQVFAMAAFTTHPVARFGG